MSFDVHVITVVSVSYDDPEGIFGISPYDAEYSIDHGACELRDEDCIVEGTLRELGLHESLFGVWDKGIDNKLQVGEYRVRGWVSRTPATPNGPEEWDAGIELVGDEEEEEWPEGTEIPFRSDGSHGLPLEGVFVIRHMPQDQEAEDGND